MKKTKKQYERIFIKETPVVKSKNLWKKIIQLIIKKE